MGSPSARLANAKGVSGRMSASRAMAWSTFAADMTAPSVEKRLVDRMPIVTGGRVVRISDGVMYRVTGCRPRLS